MPAKPSAAALMHGERYSLDGERYSPDGERYSPDREICSARREDVFRLIEKCVSAGGEI